MFDKKKLIKINQITIGIIILFLLMLTVPFAYSKLFSQTESDTQIETAFFILKEDYYEASINLGNLIPRDEPYTYKFRIANNDGTSRLETKMEYNLKIITTTNLPMSYKLYMNEEYTEEGSTNIIINDVVERDEGEDGAYFRKLETESKIFGFEQNEENIYQLVVTFPKEYDSFEYQDIIEGITIKIEAKQIITETN